MMSALSEMAVTGRAVVDAEHGVEGGPYEVDFFPNPPCIAPCEDEEDESTEPKAGAVVTVRRRFRAQSILWAFLESQLSGARTHASDPWASPLCPCLPPSPPSRRASQKISILPVVTSTVRRRGAWRSVRGQGSRSGRGAGMHGVRSPIACPQRVLSSVVQLVRPRTHSLTPHIPLQESSEQNGNRHVGQLIVALARRALAPRGKNDAFDAWRAKDEQPILC